MPPRALDLALQAEPVDVEAGNPLSAMLPLAEGVNAVPVPSSNSHSSTESRGWSRTLANKALA